MPSLDASTIEAGTKAADVASKPNVAVTLFALMAFAFCALMVWRLEVRADAQIAVMQKMADRLGWLEEDFRSAGIKLPRARPAVARDPPE